ncbi:unnamed protein product [Medioppia subpectinata]|uniref:Arrestin C-terminal-like domain-containing protein n=1 Tax=Medioppia subpectinata TaxID=1979941 RepID=A0A7R9PZF9_9ACAR|nr:unnamed protein product [Medioppia subpectinata]CAG2107044.1 unnamed protein product [Medioppia subpectinata]
MGIKLKTFAIILDKPDAIYRTSDVISGQCIIGLDGKMQLDQLKIKLRGRAECEWTEERQVTETNDEGETTTETVIDKFHNKDKHLKQEFCHQNGMYGKIEYYIKCRVKKSALFSGDEKTTLPIEIISPALPTSQDITSPVSKSNKKTVGLKVFGGKGLTLKADIARSGHNTGANIEVTCFMENKSKKAMTLKASLIESVLYTTKEGKKISTDTISYAVGPNVEAKSVSTETLSIQVPVTALVLHNTCPIISATHELDVYLDISGSFDLHCNLPVVITNF